MTEVRDWHGPSPGPGPGFASGQVLLMVDRGLLVGALPPYGRPRPYGLMGQSRGLPLVDVHTLLLDESRMSLRRVRRQDESDWPKAQGRRPGGALPWREGSYGLAAAPADPPVLWVVTAPAVARGGVPREGYTPYLHLGLRPRLSTSETDRPPAFGLRPVLTYRHSRQP